MSRRCCCGCIITTDDFNRENSTDLGPNWVESTGSDWSISNFRLSESGNSGAIARHTRSISKRYMQVLVCVMDEALGGVYSVYGNMNEDCTEYYECRYTRVNETDVTIALWKSGALIEEIPFTLSDTSFGTGVTRWISICISERAAVAGILDPSGCRAAEPNPVLIEDGYWSGVGHHNGYESQFDDFKLSDDYIPDTLCTPCYDCICDGKLPPLNLAVTYNGAGDCETLDTVTALLEANRCGAWSLSWGGDFALSGCLEDVEIGLALFCGETPDELSSWTLNMADSSGFAQTCVLGVGDLHPSEGSTCDPFILYFDIDITMVMDGTICDPRCDPCGHATGVDDPPGEILFRITITEAG